MCVCVCVCVCVLVCVYIRMYVYMCVRACVCICAFAVLNIRTYICMYVCMHVHIIRTYVCPHVHLYVCCTKRMYIYVHIFNAYIRTYVHMCVLNLYSSIIFFQDNPRCIPSSEACTNSENPIIDPVVTRVRKYIRKSVHLYVLIGIETVKYMDDVGKSFQIEERPKMQSGEESFRNHDLYIHTYVRTL